MTAWGKLAEGGARHALVAHCHDVAAVFAALARLSPFRRAMAAAAGAPLNDRQIERLTALAFIHDIGKLHPDFQAKAEGQGATIGHGSAGWGLVWLAARDAAHSLHRLVGRLIGHDPGMLPYLAACFGHHGKPVSRSHDSPAHWKDTRWQADARDFATAFDASFGDLGDIALPGAAPFLHLFTGLLALADWVGSDRDFFAFTACPDSDYPAIARARAADALRRIGLDTGALRLDDADFARMTGGWAPRGPQALIGQLAEAVRLAILEAETGSGKTEAALWHFARLYAAGQVTGLYFAVPTRAAARQLHGRLCTLTRNLFGADAPEPVLAIPGQRVAGTAHGQALPDFVTVWDDAEGPVKSRWAAEHATRFLAATIAVGTVDQAMLAAMQVKHAHLRGAALSRSLLVLDEIHASDSYMTAISRALVRAHLGAGGHALLMSATLGAVARAAYLGQDCPPVETARRLAFPALWVPGQDPITGAAGLEKRVAVRAVTGMSGALIAARAIAAARQGARVLVIRNTVDAAVAAWQAVQDAGAGDLLMQVAGGPALHHSRFAAEDRAALDTAVEASLPKAGGRPGGCIVIGTQTLEQSLDLNADFLLTDLCPMDVLLQRIGRLHRHPRPRPPAFEVPQAEIFCPEGGLGPLAAPGYENGLGAWRHTDGTVQGIYTDLPVLELTRREIAARAEWAIPSMNRDLVEAATHPEQRDAVIAELGGDWAGYEVSIAGKAAAERMAGQMGVLDRNRPVPDRFRSDDQAVLTRLGEMGPVFTLPEGSIGAFGAPIRRLAIPARWAQGLADDAPVTVAGDEIRIGDRRFRYGRAGLVRVK